MESHIKWGNHRIGFLLLSMAALLSISLASFANTGKKPKPQPLAEKISYLALLRQSVKVHLNVNLSHATSLRQCIEYLSGVGDGATAHFNYTHPSFKGWVTDQRSCNDTVKQVIRNRISEDFPKLQSYLALNQGLFSIQKERSLEPGIDGFYPEVQYFGVRSERGDHLVLSYLSKDPRGFRPSHPERKFYTVGGLEISRLKSISDAQVRELHRSYLSHVLSLCHEYTLTPRFQTLLGIGSSHGEISERQFCSFLSSTEPTDSVRTENGSNIFLIRDDFIDWAIESGKEAAFRKSNLENYYTLMNAFPLLAYVDSANPSDGELISAMSKIERNANDAILRISKKDDERSLSKRLDQFSSTNGQIPEEAEYALYQDLLDYADYPPIMSLMPYDLEVLERFDGKISKIQEISALVSHDWHNKKERESEIELAEVIGVNLVCVIPLGRGVSIASKAIKIASEIKSFSRAFNPLCMFLTGIPLNTYFFGEAILQYQRAYGEVFSTPEGKYLLKEIADLDSASANVLIGALFLPLGAQPKNIESVIKGLSVASREVYKKMSQRQGKAMFFQF